MSAILTADTMRSIARSLTTKHQFLLNELTFMRVSNVALLTLAALASHNLTANTSANPAAHPISPETPQASNFVDAVNNTESRRGESISEPETIAYEKFSPNSTVSRRAESISEPETITHEKVSPYSTASRPAESISEPETIAHEQFSPRIAVKSPTALLVAAAQPDLSATAKTKANTPARSGDELTKSLQETWLAKLIETGAESNPQVREIFAFISPSSGNSESGYGFNSTITLLNILLILGTVFPPVTIAFFWMMRRLIIKHLVADANKRLQGIGVLESELINSSQLTQKLRNELEAQMSAAKQSIDFLTRETELSKSSVEHIDTLKSQFILHLQVLMTEVDEKKSQIVQEISQVPAVVAKEALKLTPQPPLNSSQNSQTAPTSDENLIADDHLQVLRTEVDDKKSQIVQEISQVPAVVAKESLKVTPQPPLNSSQNSQTAPTSDENLIADDYIKQAEGLYFQGNYDEALGCLEKAILANKNLDEAWYWRGNVLIRLQRPEEALACYDKALSIKPDNYELWYNKAHLLGKMHRYEEAIACYERATLSESRKYGCWHSIAALLGQLQHYEEAIASYDRALAIKATDSEIWHNRGAMLAKVQQHAAAVDSYDRALELNPKRYETWYNRGNMLWRLLRYSDAINSYDRAIGIRPDKYEVWYNRAAVLGKMQRYQESIESYDKAIALKPQDFEVWHNRGAAFDKLSQHEAAIASYESAITLNSECYQAWFGKGESLAKLQRNEEAIAAYEKAIAIKPDSYDAWRHVGIVLSELKRYEEAMAAYDRAIAINPENAEAWRDRGAIISGLKQDTEGFIAGEKDTQKQAQSGESSDS
ncbi:tetratricopeptide repeat protein [Microcoleus sp. Pol11C3]|uniref:tetratricopeptide repeat protein n=1 Tax=Microcoleus sp. Pol11C3 TaxID=3055390 RepID=UPI002FD5273A